MADASSGTVASDARFDATIAYVEHYGRCLDCEAGEPHACPVLTRRERLRRHDSGDRRGGPMADASSEIFRSWRSTIDCDMLRCTAKTPHFLPWPLGQRPLPTCPFDATQTVMEQAGTWSVANVYDEVQAAFAKASSGEQIAGGGAGGRSGDESPSATRTAPPRPCQKEAPMPDEMSDTEDIDWTEYVVSLIPKAVNGFLSDMREQGHSRRVRSAARLRRMRNALALRGKFWRQEGRSDG